jgi:sigma-B regulation protein RsbU (phosphoserine phosphatase)
MAKDNDHLQHQILELEKQLQEKSSLVLIYKEEIGRMNAQLEKLIGRVQHELIIGNKIHELLVPTEIPHIPGYEFSSKFKASTVSGGDYFEIIPHEDKYKFAILMSCSSGYSMSALFLSVLLKMTGSIATKKGLSPTDFIKKVREEVMPSLRDADDASLFYAVIDRKKNEMKFAACGDFFVAHYDSTKQDVENIEINSARLKKSNTAFSPTTGTLKLSPEDRFVIASTGLLEQTNEASEAYGRKRLLDVFKTKTRLSTHELRNEFFVDLESFSNRVPAQRDWTLLLMDVKTNLVQLSIKD